MRFITETSAITNSGKIISFFPCKEGDIPFLYGVGEISCEVTPYRDELLSKATHFYPVCPSCFKPVTGKMKSARYCSPYCRITHHRIKKKIQDGSKYTNTQFISGYYRIEKTSTGYDIHLRGWSPLSVKVVENSNIRSDECIWKPKYAPVLVDGGLSFIVVDDNREKEIDGLYRIAFLKAVLELGIWK